MNENIFVFLPYLKKMQIIILDDMFMIWPILEARAEIQKYFRSFLGSNENFKICFQD